jgi:putative peptidoglycan lipid II flippase
MVNKVKKLFSREISGLHEAAYLLATFSVFSQIFALVRDRLLASSFGTSLTLDVYYASFKLPDLMFVLVSTLVSISVLVPRFVNLIENKKKLKNLVDSIFTILSVLSLVLVLIAFFLAPKFLDLVVPNLLASNLGGELVVFTRILLIQPIILSISSLLGSLVQAYRKFMIYALAPILYNLGIIVGIIFLYPIYGLKGLAYGVVIGAFAHLLLQIPFIFEERIYPKLTFKIKFKQVWFIVSNSFPRTASMLGNQGTLTFLIFLAGTMTYGSISTFNLSYNLQSVPMAIIGVSYSLAAFPALSKFFHEKKFKEFYASINKALRHIIFWSLPVMAMFVVLRAQIVRVILGSGNFDWEATRLVAASLALFTISIFAQSISLLFLRAYYSMEKTLKPFLITSLSFAVIIVSSLAFIKVLTINSTTTDFVKDLLRLGDLANITVLALPLAYSIGQILNMVLLISFFGNIKRFINKDLLRSSFQSLTASLLALIIAFISLNALDRFFDLNTLVGVFLQGFLSGVIALIAAFVFLVVIDNKEVKVALETARTKFWKGRVVSPEVEEEL